MLVKIGKNIKTTFLDKHKNKLLLKKNEILFYKLNIFLPQ